MILILFIQPALFVCLFGGVRSTPLNDSNSEVEITHHAISYKGYRLVRIFPSNDEDVDRLHTFLENNSYEGSGIDIWSEARSKNSPVDVLVSPTKMSDAMRFLNSTHIINSTILIDDVGDDIERKRAPEQRAKMKIHPKYSAMTPVQFFQDFQRLNDIHSFMDNLAQRYPDLLTVESIGKTFENREMRIFKISSKTDNEKNEKQHEKEETPSSKQTKRKPKFFLDAGIHAREWVAPSTAMMFAYTLVQQYANNSRIRRIVDNMDLIVLPVANPDGYEYSHTHDRLWRKTRSKNGGTACVGVDPNRNFAYMWRVKGASSNPCSYMYAGPKPFSERETQNMANYIMKNRKDIRAYVTLHSYSQLWLTPWGWTREVPSDYENLKNKAERAVAALSRLYGTRYRVGTSTRLLYAAAGGSDDWVKGAAGIPYAYTIELRPGSNERNGFVIDSKLIKPIGFETTMGLIQLAEDILRDENQN